MLKTTNLLEKKSPFAGNGLAFHTLSGAKFTVTYTVAATALLPNSLFFNQFIRVTLYSSKQVIQ